MLKNYNLYCLFNYSIYFAGVLHLNLTQKSTYEEYEEYDEYENWVKQTVLHTSKYIETE